MASHGSRLPGGKSLSRRNSRVRPRLQPLTFLSRNPSEASALLARPRPTLHFGGNPEGCTIADDIKLHITHPFLSTSSPPRTWKPSTGSPIPGSWAPTALLSSALPQLLPDHYQSHLWKRTQSSSIVQSEWFLLPLPYCSEVQHSTVSVHREVCQEGDAGERGCHTSGGRKWLWQMAF